jgi:hypothetical protein
MKNNLFLYFLSSIILISCSFKPLYKKTNYFFPHKVEIIIKSLEKYENNVSIMKSHLNQKLNLKNSKDSDLKLVVSIVRNVLSLGINKDLNSYTSEIVFKINYSFYDKKGLLLTGNLKNSSSFNITSNNYANILALEDASNKLTISLSNDIANQIIAGNFSRKVRP